MKERLATFMCAGSIIALLGFLAGFTWSEETWSSGSISSPSTPLAVPTEDPGPHAMYLVTMTPQTTETPAPTAKPWQTSTSVPDCIATEAIPGLPCVKHAPTKTPSVATVVPICNVPPATIETGQLCIWPR